MGTELIPIAVVEDHPLYRRGLTQTATQSDSLDLVAATSSLEELDPTDLKRAAVVILDLHLPGIEGADAVRFVRWPAPRSWFSLRPMTPSRSSRPSEPAQLGI